MIADGWEYKSIVVFGCIRGDCYGILCATCDGDIRGENHDQECCICVGRCAWMHEFIDCADDGHDLCRILRIHEKIKSRNGGSLLLPVHG